MNTQILDKARDILAESTDPSQGVFADLIEMLLPILLDLLSGCIGLGNTGDDILSLARTNPRNARVILKRALFAHRRELRRKYGLFAYLRYEGEMVEMSLRAANLKAQSGDYRVSAGDVTEFANLPPALV